jgi:Tol biopolymer transport system component
MNEKHSKCRPTICINRLLPLTFIILLIMPSIHTQIEIIGTTEVVSKSSQGIQGNNWSARPAISSNGRYVSFVSSAINLVANDSNGVMDIFVFDRTTKEITRISIATDGTEANNNSDEPSISADGRYVVFVSSASNLYEDDTNGQYDVFIRDRDTDEDGIYDEPGMVVTVRVFDSPSQTANISANGRYIVSQSAMLIDNKLCGLTVFDRETSQYSCAYETYDGTLINGGVQNAYLSADGQFVTYTSDASNLVLLDTNGKRDVFVYNLLTHQTVRVSVSSNEEQANGDSDKPVISADGRYVAFSSQASNLVEGDTFGYWDVFVRDVLTGETTRISVAQDGSEAFNHSDAPSISADGQFIAFESLAGNLVIGDTNAKNDIFLHNLITGENVLISVAVNGQSGNGWSNCYTGKIISADGLKIAFQSDANNLVTVDQNDKTDVFVREIEYSYRINLPIIISAIIRS